MTSAGAPRLMRCQPRHLDKHPAKIQTDIASAGSPRLTMTIHVERYHRLRATHQSENTGSVYTWIKICFLCTLCEKYSHDSYCSFLKNTAMKSADSSPKQKGNNNVIQTSRGRIQLATCKACQQTMCSTMAIAKCGSTLWQYPGQDQSLVHICYQKYKTTISHIQLATPSARRHNNAPHHLSIETLHPALMQSKQGTFSQAESLIQYNPVTI